MHVHTPTYTHTQACISSISFRFESDISQIFSQGENDFRSSQLTGTDQNQNAY